MELLPNLFLQVSVIQKNMCSTNVGLNFGAVTACRHSHSIIINHHTFDQNAANLTVSCDGRTMEGCVRSYSANWVSPANGHLDGR